MPNRRIKRKEKVLFACSFIVFTTLLMLLIPTLSYSQLTLSNVGANYTTLATSLTSDPNVVISNASGKRRSNKQMAFFFNPGGNNLQVTSGIVLTTGDIEASNKVLNTEGDFTGDHSEFPMNPADQQLLSVSFPGAEIYDYAILEFDLKINNGSGVQFNYVFASEEYPEYVCAHFDDAFGLWIKGGTEYPDYTI
ncbi:MAG TPA: choice-of-anchor L domain-containing protein [Cytophagaceae bacterium]